MISVQTNEFWFLLCWFALHVQQDVCMLHKTLEFQLCVCIYMCVCSVPGVPSPSFVIRLSADCDMEAPAIAPLLYFHFPSSSPSE